MLVFFVCALFSTPYPGRIRCVFHRCIYLGPFRCDKNYSLWVAELTTLEEKVKAKVDALQQESQKMIRMNASVIGV